MITIENRITALTPGEKLITKGEILVLSGGQVLRIVPFPDGAISITLEGEEA